MIGEEVIAVYGDAGDGEELFEVQKLVRCRECKHWQPHEQYGYDEDNDEYHDYCGLLVPEDDYYAIERKADDFCSYGNSSEKPNNCEHITEDGVTCAKYPACDDCLDNPLNKVKGSKRLVKGSERSSE